MIRNIHSLYYGRERLQGGAIPEIGGKTMYMEWTYYRENEIVTLTLGADQKWTLSFGTVDNYGYHWVNRLDIDRPGDYHDFLIDAGYVLEAV